MRPLHPGSPTGPIGAEGEGGAPGDGRFPLCAPGPTRLCCAFASW